MTSEALMRNVAATLESTRLNGASDVATRYPYLYDPILPKQVDAPMLDDETDDEEHYDERSQLAELHNDENEFGNTELENLVLVEGPQQILQLILQGQVDDFMEEEITDSDDYADWIKWASNAEERRHAIFKSKGCIEVPVLLQVHQTDNTGTPSDCSGKLTLPNNQDVSIRWKEIC